MSEINLLVLLRGEISPGELERATADVPGVTPAMLWSAFSAYCKAYNEFKPLGAPPPSVWGYPLACALAAVLEPPLRELEPPPELVRAAQELVAAMPAAVLMVNVQGASFPAPLALAAERVAAALRDHEAACRARALEREPTDGVLESAVIGSILQEFCRRGSGQAFTITIHGAGGVGPLSGPLAGGRGGSSPTDKPAPTGAGGRGGASQ